MNHSYYRDKISAYFDNELPAQEKEIVKRHLQECQECQDLLVELKTLDQAVDKHTQLAGGDYWERSAQRIEQRLGFTEETTVLSIIPSRWKGLVPKLAAVAASVAVLGFIALYERNISKETSLPVMESSESPQIAVEKESLPSVKAGELKMLVPADTEVRTVARPVEITKKTKKAEGHSQRTVDEETTPPVRKGQAALVQQIPLKDKEQRSPSDEVANEIGREKATRVPLAAEAGSDKSEEGLITSVQDSTLRYWRHRRDSLQSLYAELTSLHQALSNAKSRRKGKGLSLEVVEKQLIHSYYQIALLARDDEERAAAISYLADYRRNDDSRCKEQAEIYLEELRRGKK